MAPMRFVGVDGCKGGWFSVGLDQNGYDFWIFRGFADLLSHYKDAELILVDMPIGLPEDKKGRDCDGEARKKINPRGSSVFPTPTRQTVEQAAKSREDYLKRRQSHRKDGGVVEQAAKSREDYYLGAKEVEKQYSGKGLSRQAFGIAPKIAEVDKIMAHRTPNKNPRVREVHPELCFWALNGGQHLKSSKHNLKGKSDRLCILERVDRRATEIFEKACSKVCSSSSKDQKVGKIDVGFDDILDGMVAAITAYHGYDQLDKLPVNDNQKDSKGLPMEMVFWKPG